MNDPDIRGLLQIDNDLPMREMLARINAFIDEHGDEIPDDDDDDDDDAEPPPARQNEDRNAVAQAVPAHDTMPQLDHLDRNHEGWRFAHGAGRCQQCGEDMPVFLMECVTCQVKVCRRCTLNWW